MDGLNLFISSIVAEDREFLSLFTISIGASNAYARGTAASASGKDQPAAINTQSTLLSSQPLADISTAVPVLELPESLSAVIVTVDVVGVGVGVGKTPPFATKVIPLLFAIIEHENRQRHKLLRYLKSC